MQSILSKAIQISQHHEIVYTKFISANDVGKTSHGKSRSHQAGFYISKPFLPYVFEKEVVKDVDYEQLVTIKWQDDFETDSRFKYYGSKNECHLTRLGDDFPYRSDQNIGDLLILCKENTQFYHGFVLNTDEDIEDFLAALNFTSTSTNTIIPKQNEVSAEVNLEKCFSTYIRSLDADFPSTAELALNARNCCNSAYSIRTKDIIANPDKEILRWLDIEFQLFKAIENELYSTQIKVAFKSVEEFVETANTILQRRKSRAGKSLEHHLAEIFWKFSLDFSPQGITEGKKKPDFIFPSEEAYHDPKFDDRKLLLLASKTTCKDRWRQVLNEADRIKTKHLFTLQQGISKNQLEEMYKCNICLIVPKPYLRFFPKKFRNQILTLDEFVKLAKKRQS